MVCCLLVKSKFTLRPWTIIGLDRIRMQPIWSDEDVFRFIYTNWYWICNELSSCDSCVLSLLGPRVPLEIFVPSVVFGLMVFSLRLSLYESWLLVDFNEMKRWILRQHVHCKTDYFGMPCAIMILIWELAQHDLFKEFQTVHVWSNYYNTNYETMHGWDWHVRIHSVDLMGRPLGVQRI